MPTAHSSNRTNASSSLARRLAWPGTISLVLAAIAACGGSSAGDANFNDAFAGSGGLGIAGKGTTAGHNSGTAGSASGNATGGKQGIPESPAGGDSSSGPDEGGAGGEPGKPGEPKPGEPKPGEPKPGEPKPGEPKPPLGMAGAAGLDEDCPLEPPTDKAACTEEMLKCAYPDISCDCAGPEDDRTWKCKLPPKPMSMCPPMPPKDASACKTQDPPAAPCHYEDPALDCTCSEDQWTCTQAL